MLKLKENKGITLIALIITIIVMLILVGVTINVALNGGLFKKAEQAKTQTQKETDQEELQIAVVAALNDDLEIPDANAIKNNLPENWSVTGPENGVYTCISPKLNKFTVNKADKKITYKGTSDGKTEEPKFYGVGYDTQIGEIPVTLYFFEDDIVVQKININSQISYSAFSIAPYKDKMSISEGYNTVTIEGMGSASRNENDIINWDKEYAPVFVCLGSSSAKGDKSPSLSNTSFQEKGEYKTTLIIGDGKYSAEDCTITFSVEGVSSREYIEGEDYSYNTSTGEFVIFNLTEPVMITSISIK